MKPYRYEQDFGNVTVVYGRQPSTRERSEPSIAKPHSIDIGFIGHERTLVRQPGGPVYARKIPAGTGGMHGFEPLEFVYVEGPSEYLELLPSLSVRTDAAAEFNSSAAISFDEIQDVDNLVLWTVATRFRAHAMGGWPLEPLAADVLIRCVVSHLVCTRLGGQPPRINDARLSSSVLNQLRDYIEANIQTNITLQNLATLAHCSPYHFIRMFTRTTGINPHEFVQSIRMERAKEALLSGAKVKSAALAVGYVHGHSFRKAFHRYFGTLPSLLLKAIQ